MSGPGPIRGGERLRLLLEGCAPLVRRRDVRALITEKPRLGPKLLAYLRSGRVDLARVALEADRAERELRFAPREVNP
jgi:hypothetical protein